MTDGALSLNDVCGEGLRWVTGKDGSEPRGNEKWNDAVRSGHTLALAEKGGPTDRA